MEEKLPKVNADLSPASQITAGKAPGHVPPLPVEESELMRIRSEELFQSGSEYPTRELAGVYFNGIQYFDFTHVPYLSNSEMARLVNLLKSLLKKGIEIKLVNASAQIQQKIRSMGLESIL
ncbi:MAG: STAS domain-containing protein [Bacteroidota bacterium]